MTLIAPRPRESRDRQEPVKHEIDGREVRAELEGELGRWEAVGDSRFLDRTHRRYELPGK